MVKQGQMEQREGPWGRWTPCHVELTPCELRLYTLDSSANLQLGTAYSLSHCQSVVSPAPCGQIAQHASAAAADQRTLQALFFNSTRLQLRAASQWEAMEWRRVVWEKVQVARPVRQENRQRKVEKQQLAKFPAPMSPSSSPSPSGLDTRPDGESDTPTAAEEASHSHALLLQSNGGVLSRPTTLPLFTQRCHDVLKAGLLHQLVDQNNWRTFTFVLSRSALQAFPTEGRGSVSQPVLHFSLASCLAVQQDQEPDNEGPWADRRERFQVGMQTIY